MIEVIFLCGLPGSGKTTARAMFPSTFKVVSSDDYIERMAREISTTYNEAFSTYIKEADKIFKEDIRFHIRNGQSFIVDRTLLTEKSRAKMMDFIAAECKASGLDVEFSIVAFSTPVGVILERNRERATHGRGIPEHVLDSMISSFSLPSPHEGFSDIYTMINDGTLMQMNNTQGSKRFK